MAIRGAFYRALVQQRKLERKKHESIAKKNGWIAILANLFLFAIGGGYLYLGLWVDAFILFVFTWTFLSYSLWGLFILLWIGSFIHQYVTILHSRRLVKSKRNVVKYQDAVVKFARDPPSLQHPRAKYQDEDDLDDEGEAFDNETSAHSKIDGGKLEDNIRKINAKIKASNAYIELKEGEEIAEPIVPKINFKPTQQKIEKPIIRAATTEITKPVGRRYVCSNCRTENRYSSRFCKKCGNKL